MVTEEFLPLLADRGLDTRRIGLYGYSMGACGALRLGALLGPDRVAAVAAVSPALWSSFDRSAPGAHDLDYWRRVAPAELSFLWQHLG